MFKYAAAALVALAGATPALAQDAESTFTGFRVEGIVGWDNAKLGGGFKDSGIAYGIGAGYDTNIGGGVVGVEVEAADSTVKKFGVKAKRDLYVGIRGGAEVSTGLLLYGKLGYTNARLGAGGFNVNLDGVRVGAGLEYQVGSNMYVKGEYRYSNYELGITRHQAVLGVGVRF